MWKSTLIVLSLTLTFFMVVEPVQTVHGIIMTPAELRALDAANVEAASRREKSEEKGNGFVRALTAPFRALGRLFGGGKKNSRRLERISNKDIEKFEAAKKSASNAKSTTAVVRPNPVVPDTSRTIVANTIVPAPTANTEHLDRGRALLNEHDLNGAISELTLALTLDPKSGDAHSLLGVAYWRKGLRDRAQTSFEAAVKLRKDDPQHLNNLGYLLYETGDFDGAAKYLKRAVKLAPDDARILNNLGLAQCERGKYDDAFKSFARALGDYTGHINIAARLERHGQGNKAIKHLEQALALKPNSPDVLSKLADLYDREDKPEKAQTARATLKTMRTLADAATK